MICSDYCGITCVNGQCPETLANEYPEYGYSHISCEECRSNKSCKDCLFENEECFLK